MRSKKNLKVEGASFRVARFILGGVAVLVVSTLVFMSVNRGYFSASIIGTNISTSGNLIVGDGTPDVVQDEDGEDAYVEGTFEVDGAARFDGALLANGATTVDTLLTTPQSAQSLSAGSAVAVNSSFEVVQPSGAAAVTLASTPHIADGTAGQHLWLTGGNNHGVILTNQRHLASSNVVLGDYQRVLRSGSMLHILFDGSNWVEVGFSNGNLGELIFQDDFIGQLFQDTIWNVVVGTVALSADVTDPGALKLTTGVISGDQAQITYNAVGFAPFSELPVSRIRFRLASASSVDFGIGFTETVGTDMVGFGPVYDSAGVYGGTPPVTANFWFFAVHVDLAGIPVLDSNYLDTGVALDTAYHVAETRAISPTQAAFYFDESYVGTLSIPNAKSFTNTTDFQVLIKTMVGEAKSMYVDYVKLYSGR